ncbi:CapA family protein [Candidatus Nomurabacteria bacterium]|nr:CapA family protein [Candidatus Nomurabacteria bacterium]
MSSTPQGKIRILILLFCLTILSAFYAFTVVPKGYTSGGESEDSVGIVALATGGGEKGVAKYYFTKNKKQKPNIGALSYVVGDLNTGKIILAKNQNKKFPIASVSKLMTALVLEDLGSDSGMARISKSALSTEGSNGSFVLNEQIKISDLLYPLLLESSNDAAEAIAEYASRDVFIKKMNDKAEELGLASTSFSDPSGLSPLNQSTSFDLFQLAKYVKDKKPDLLTKTTNKSYSNKKHIWFNNSQFLRHREYEGGKSGYIDEALQTGVFIFSIPLGEEKHSVAISILHSKDRYNDIENILSYLKKNIYYGTEESANTAWIKEGAREQEKKEFDSVTLAFVGDIMLDRGVKSSVLKNFAGDYSKLFEKLEILKKSDIVFGNLEGTASDKGRDGGSLYSFRMDPGVIPALKGAGFGVLSVANNHVGDWGINSYTDTLTRLKENEIFYTGGGMTESEAEQPVVIEKQGIKVGYLAFSDKGPDWMRAGIARPGLLLASNPRFDEIIKNAKNMVDFLVVSFHFGEEYQDVHNERQEYLAHRAIDNGAKIVVGHHPHVAQDSEIYKNGYIIYSLGNFIFDQVFSKKTMEGTLLEIKLNEVGEMVTKKNTVMLSKFFQPENVIEGKEEKFILEEVKKIE